MGCNIYGTSPKVSCQVKVFWWGGPCSPTIVHSGTHLLNKQNGRKYKVNSIHTHCTLLFRWEPCSHFFPPDWLELPLAPPGGSTNTLRTRVRFNPNLGSSWQGWVDHLGNPTGVRQCSHHCHCLKDGDYTQWKKFQAFSNRISLD